jgi:tyrosine-specific transport protein
MLKSFNTKLLGGTLLLTGTAMGGGLLALPLATAKAGCVNAAYLMITCWALMTASALLTLEVSLWLPPEFNIISMSATLLNPAITGLAWFSYLCLFYSLLAAYISGGTDLLGHLLQGYVSVTLAKPLAAMLFTGFLGSIVYQGIYWVDYLNRGFMAAKLVLYIGLVLLILPQHVPHYWLAGETQYWAQGFGVLITAFSFANVIPSLRQYFGEDIASLRKAILWGSSIPLICYLIWNMSIMGIIPLSGENGLIQINQSAHPVHDLIAQLNQVLSHPLLFLFSNTFSYICVFTTFLTCSWGLSDFLTDGLGLTKHASMKENSLIYGSTFIPPLLISLFFPGLFIKALHYASIYCLILFVLIPVMMAWRGRYQLNYSTLAPYQLPGGRLLLIFLGLVATVGLIDTIYYAFIA